MTREEIKRHLDRKPLVWQESKFGTEKVSFYNAEISLIDGNAEEEEEESLKIGFGITVNKARRGFDVSLSVRGKWELGTYEIAYSRGHAIPLEELKNKAEAYRLDLACRMLGIKE